MTPYPHLFSPVKVGNVVLRNRILTAPTGCVAQPDNMFDEVSYLYYERKAIGGAAAVCVSELMVDPRRGGRGIACIDASNFRAMGFLSKITDKITRHGAVASAELSHCGIWGKLGLGPSECVVEGRTTPAMMEQDILETIEAYAVSADNAKKRGFEMVTVHGGHGWLPQQFFSPATNRRTDRWGGSVENRARFAVMICDAIHEKCGSGYPIEFRISASEYDEGYSAEEGIEYAKALDGHADIIHVSSGVHGVVSGTGPAAELYLVFTPGMFTPEGHLVHFAAEIKKHVKKSYVATVSSITDPAMMEDIIATGKADFVAIARGLMCDPDLPKKAQAGRTDEILYCLRCMSCTSNKLSSGQNYCAINPKTSREAETLFYMTPAERKTVLVAGGGIAGMQAAVTAAENGHKVILCDKSDGLGGGMRCERNVPFKYHIHGYIGFQERMLAKLGVDVRLGTEVTRSLAEAIKPDVLILALGSRPIRPAIEGIDGRHVLSAQEAFQNPELVGRRAVVIGAGLVGCELAIYLNMLGRSVEVVEMGNAIKADGLNAQGKVVSKELRERGMSIRFHTTAKRVTAEGLEYEGPDDIGLIPAETVIYAVGQSPLFKETGEFQGAVPLVHMIGDCIGVKNIFSAVKTAYTIARDIGR